MLIVGVTSYWPFTKIALLNEMGMVGDARSLDS